MSVPSREVLRTGRGVAPEAPLTLHAGPLRVLLDGADLRHVAVGSVELVQRVYVAVRDAPWNTIPAHTRDWVYELAPDQFRVTFAASHRHADIAFDWDGIITGSPEGVIRYQIDGVCRGVFQFSKIGFNIHHALAGTVGRRYRAQTEHGELRGTLPKAIDPQRIVDGTLSGMFDPYSELAIEVADGTESVVALEGDLLELQDHRNWTDANFKSYATPLRLGFPFTSTDGQRIHQVLTIGHAGSTPGADLATDPTVRIGAAVGPLPAIGFGVASHDGPLGPREAELLRALRPDHLRVDLVMRDGEWEAALERGVAEARVLGAALELAVAANESTEAPLTVLAGRLRTAGVPVSRVLVSVLTDGFSALVSTTPAPIVALVRRVLEPGAPDVVFAGGTNQNFSDVNRERPSDPVYGGICFAISPTVHAADDASIVENLAGQAEVVRMARSFGGERPICVSPVTIATRFGPYPAGPAADGDLPAAVDVRQASLLGAAWTVGSIAALAGAGASSVTWYETRGWRGVVERDAGSPMATFPSVPGQVFPLYHVFADVAEWRGGTVHAVQLSHPLRAVALAVATGDGLHLLVANVTAEAQRVQVAGLTGEAAAVRVLDEASATWALTDPAAFRGWLGGGQPVRDGTLWLALGPYAVARVDAA